MAGYVEMFNLGKTYDTPNGPAVIVEQFNLNMSQGEYVCLLGHSGCGKSTVLTMVAGLLAVYLLALILGAMGLAGKRAG